MTDGPVDLLEEAQRVPLQGPGTESHTALGNCPAEQALVVGRQCLGGERIKGMFQASETY